MVDAKLGAKPRWALLALMALGGEVSNPELKQVVGFSLVGEERRLLNDLKLVVSRGPRPYFDHELTEAGWQWCAGELSCRQQPKGTGLAGGALYAVLDLLQRYLDHADLTLLEFCQRAAVNGPTTVAEEAEPINLEEHIRRAYQKLSGRPGQWVSLTDLRSLLRTADRTKVDDALRELNRLRGVHIVPESNQKALSALDREAAVRIGGENSHLISIEKL